LGELSLTAVPPSTGAIQRSLAYAKTICVAEMSGVRIIRASSWANTWGTIEDIRSTSAAAITLGDFMVRFAVVTE
jgi:hypothetical protein